MGHGRLWTEEEINYLKEKWGAISKEAIAKNLNRTEEAINNKVHRLKLGPSR